MYMLSVSVALAAVALHLPIHQDRSIANDSLLKEPISLSVANRPVSEVLRSITKLTKAPLNVSKLIADAKVTIYVDKEPAWKTLDRVADVLMADWNPSDDGGFRLGVANETTSYRRTYIERSDAIDREAVELQIRELARDADTPFPALDLRRRTLEAELASTSSPSRSKEIQTSLDALRNKLDPVRYSLGMVFRSMRPAELASFWEGRAIYATLPTVGRQNRRGGRNGRSGGNNQADQNVQNIQMADDASQDEPVKTGPSAQVFAKYDVVHHTLKLSGKAALAPAKAKPKLDASSLERTTFGKMIADWPKITIDPADRRASEGARVTLDDRTPGTLADALAQFHEQTHLPVVADGSRTMYKLDVRGANLSEFVRDFSNKTGAYVKVNGSFVEVRHPQFWTLLEREVPESKFDALEEVAAKRTPTVDDYAAFFTGLTPLQVAYVTSDIPQVMRFETQPIREAWPAIRAYASLVGLSRESAYQEAGFHYRQMDANQRTLFVAAIAEGVFIKIPDGVASQVIQAANDPQLMQNFAIHVVPFGGVDAASEQDKMAIRFGAEPTVVSYSFIAVTGR